MNGCQVRLRHSPPSVEVGQWATSDHGHDPLNHSREEEEGNGDAKEGVEDAEGLPSIRERNSVAIT